jgi:uncharacterized protein
MSETLGRGIAFPFGVDERGRIALAADETDVAQAIGLVVATAPGERPMRPEFGCAVHELVFEVLDAQTLRRVEEAVRLALDRWEPRIDVESIAFDTSDAAVLRIVVDYRLRATNDLRNLVYPFYMIPTEEDA